MRRPFTPKNPRRSLPMPTNDFIEDAVQALDTDPEQHYFLITCRAGSPYHSAYAFVESSEQLRWMRRQVMSEFDHIEKQLKEREA